MFPYITISNEHLISLTVVLLFVLFVCQKLYIGISLLADKILQLFTTQWSSMIVWVI